MTISSPSNPRIKAAVKLRAARERAERGLIIIDGTREIARALEGGVSIRTVFVCPVLCRDEACRRLLQLLADSNKIERLEVTPEVFEKIAFGQRQEGIVAVAEMPVRGLNDISLPAKPAPLVAVLENIEKPGNLGAVLRSADGAGVSALIAADAGTDLFNPNAIRASLGTIFSLPVAAATSAETLAWLRTNKLKIYAARVDGAVDYIACDFRGPCALVLGSEADGLTDAWRGDDITAIRLPMRGIADSLNISATAAVLFYEALRQRTPS